MCLDFSMYASQENALNAQFEPGKFSNGKKLLPV